MVSVIIPVYNVRSYLDQCLDSVVKQTFPDFEVILINDGSTDGSDQKCSAWAQNDARIRYISQKNQGLGPTRNKGVQLAKYDYLTFLDSDDWWDSAFLEKMLQAILRLQADMAVCDIVYVPAEKNQDYSHSEIRLPDSRPLSAEEEPDLLNRVRTFAWGKIYRKALFENNNLAEPAHAFEDIPVTPLAVALAGSVCRVAGALYYYRRGRAGSLAGNPDNYPDVLKSLQLLKNGFVQRDLFSKYHKPLKKLTHSQIRFIAGKDQHCPGLMDSLFGFMRENYPGDADFLTCTFGVIGPCLANAARNLALQSAQLVFCLTLAEARAELPAPVDFILLDGYSLVQNGPWPQDIWQKIFARCKQAVFVQTYPANEDAPRLKERYLRLIKNLAPLTVADAGETPAGGYDEGACWNIADAVFYALNAEWR